MSILRNGNVPSCYFLNVPVGFKMAQCRLSILRNGNVPCQYFENVPADFMVVQCCLPNFRKCHVTLSNTRAPLRVEHLLTRAKILMAMVI